jgi:hypothetical protein
MNADRVSVHQSDLQARQASLATAPTNKITSIASNPYFAVRIAHSKGLSAATTPAHRKKCTNSSKPTAINMIATNAKAAQNV